MKALSIKQPWANLIINKKKIIEIRKWKTKYRGDFIIHSGNEIDERAKKVFRNVSHEPRGCILGIAKIIDIKLYSSIHEFKDDYHCHLNPLEWYEKGIYGFILDDIRKINPVQLSGSLGLFETNINLSDLEIFD